MSISFSFLLAFPPNVVKGELVLCARILSEEIQYEKVINDVYLFARLTSTVLLLQLCSCLQRDVLKFDPLSYLKEFWICELLFWA